MPWKEGKPMDERLRFVARLLDGVLFKIHIHHSYCRQTTQERTFFYLHFEAYFECR